MQWHGLRINQQVITTQEIKFPNKSLCIPIGTKGTVTEIFLSEEGGNYAKIKFKNRRPKHAEITAPNCIRLVKNKKRSMRCRNVME